MSAPSLDVISVDDPRFADAVAEAGADVFYRPEFCRFRLAGSLHRAVMLRYQDTLSGGSVLDVTTLREVSRLPFLQARPGDDGALESTVEPIDLASPEYNGPLVHLEERSSAGWDERVARAQLLAAYRRAVDGYCRDTGVVTEFVRLHPLSSETDTAGLLASLETLVPVGELVYVDVRDGYAAAERGYRKGHRAAIKRAAREQCRVDIVSPSPEAIARLAALYDATMKRADAAARYVHGPSFFVSLFAQLGDCAMLVEARTGDGALAASAVFLRGTRHLWYLYAGTEEIHRASGANNYKIDRMVHWAAERGFAYVVLGGGFEPGDGLFLTKRGYSHKSATVHHLRKVHDPVRLAELEEEKRAYDTRRGRPTRTDYFPSYWLGD